MPCALLGGNLDWHPRRRVQRVIDLGQDLGPGFRLFSGRISEVFACDDASDDGTYLVGLGNRQLSEHLPITVIRHTRNLGCGGYQSPAANPGARTAALRARAECLPFEELAPRGRAVLLMACRANGESL